MSCLTVDGRWKMLEYSYIDGNHSPTTVEHFRGICEGLKEIHSLGYVHGDIRLANMIFFENGGSQLIDFDLARIEHKRYCYGYKGPVDHDERHTDAVELHIR